MWRSDLLTHTYGKGEGEEVESIKENSKTRSRVMNERLIPYRHVSTLYSHSLQEGFDSFAGPSPGLCEQGPLLQFNMSALPFPDMHLWFY